MTKRKVVTEVNIPEGATHYGGSLTDDPTFYKQVGDDWLLYVKRGWIPSTDGWVRRPIPFVDPVPVKAKYEKLLGWVIKYGGHHAQCGIGGSHTDGDCECRFSAIKNRTWP